MSSVRGLRAMKTQTIAREREWKGEGWERLLPAAAPLIGLAYILVLPLVGLYCALHLAVGRLANRRRHA